MIRHACLKWITAVYLLETLLFEVLFAVIKVGSCCCETTTNMAEKTFFSRPVNCNYSKDIKSCWGVYVVTDFQLCADFCLQRFVFWFCYNQTHLQPDTIRDMQVSMAILTDKPTECIVAGRMSLQQPLKRRFTAYYNMTEMVCVFYYSNRERIHSTYKKSHYDIRKYIV